ncbi:MAG: ATP-binding protein [Methanomicrobium sp.]|nr:ATP-binding protein [Methanomicrobium sp.]
MIHLDIVIPAKNDEIDRVTADIEKILTVEDFSAEEIFNVQLAMEEIIENIINYGYPGKEGMIGIRCEVTPSEISIEISDSAPAFNPLLMPDPDITSDVDERNIGGLGIFLVKKVMDKVSYIYENNKNILTLVKFKNE